MSYLGIDIGMTGAKALVVSEEGKVLRKRYTDYGNDYKENILKEINPNHIWEGIRKIIKACQCKKLKEPVKTISASVSGDDFFPADRMGRPLTNVISAYQDTGKEYEDFIIKNGGGERKLFEITGQPIRDNVYPLHRMLWIKNNLPEIYEKTWKFLGWEEYINYLLTGECISDYSLVSRTLLFDVNKKEWSKSLIRKMGLEYDKFPGACRPGKVIGKVRRKIAQELDLPSNCLVTTGGFDQATASLGAGVTRQSGFSLSIGTVIASHWLIDDRSTINNKDYSCCCSLVGDKYLGFFFSFNGCAVLDWFFREIRAGNKHSSKTGNLYGYYNKQITTGSPSRLFMMPHLGGATQPYNDGNSKGVLLGIRLNTKNADILKAIYEGIAFDLKRNYTLLGDDNIDVKDIRVAGGGSRSDVWMQIMANVLDCEITTLKVDEGSSMGAALLGAYAIGDFGSIEEVSNLWVKRKEAVRPEPGSVREFEKKYQKYLKLYENVKSFNSFLERYDE